MRVGFIGLGSQGAPMARRIIEAGYPTTLWARRGATLEQFVDTTAVFAESPAALAADCDVVCLCVVGDDDVRAVITGENGLLAGARAGLVIVVHSTVHPSTCRELADLVRAHDVVLIDAPVSGGGGAASEGRLLVMVGGATESVERCRPILQTYGNPVVHLGGIGSGQVTKLLNNVLFTANLATAASTLALGEAIGLSPGQLGEVITHGTADSFALERIVAAGGTLDRLAAHAGDLLRKDVGLIADLAAAADITPGVVLTAADATLAMIDRPR